MQGAHASELACLARLEPERHFSCDVSYQPAQCEAIQHWPCKRVPVFIQQELYMFACTWRLYVCSTELLYMIIL